MSKERYYSAERIENINKNIEKNKDKFIEKIRNILQKLKLRLVLVGGVSALTLSGCSFAEKNYSETPPKIEAVIEDVETSETEETGLICVLERTVVDENNPNESHIEREQITAESIQQAIKQAEELGYNTIGIKLPKEYTLTRGVKIPDGFKLYLYGDSDSLSTVNLCINNGTTIPSFELGKDSGIFASHLNLTRNDSTYRGTFIESISDTSEASLTNVISQNSLKIEGSYKTIEIKDCNWPASSIRIDKSNRADKVIIKRSTIRSVITSDTNNVSIEDGRLGNMVCNDGKYFSATNSVIGNLGSDNCENVLFRGDSFSFVDIKDTSGIFEDCDMDGKITVSSSPYNKDEGQKEVSLNNCRVNYVELQAPDQEQTLILVIKGCSGFTENTKTTVITGDKTQKVDSSQTFDTRNKQQRGNNNSTDTNSTTKQKSTNGQGGKADKDDKADIEER